MPKLTDTQLVILSGAAARKDGVLLPLPKTLKANKEIVASSLKSLMKQGLVVERLATRDDVHWRQQGDQRFTLIISEDGAKALEAGPDSKDAPKPAPAKRPAKAAKAVSKIAGKRANLKQPPTAKGGTKQALLVDLLNRKAGASIKEAVKATGWQAHSVRGAISGTLKKKLGLKVASDTIEGRGRVYRIVTGR